MASTSGCSDVPPTLWRESRHFCSITSDRHQAAPIREFSAKRQLVPIKLRGWVKRPKQEVDKAPTRPVALCSHRVQVRSVLSDTKSMGPAQQVPEKAGFACSGRRPRSRARLVLYRAHPYCFARNLS